MIRRALRSARSFRVSEGFAGRRFASSGASPGGPGKDSEFPGEVEAPVITWDPYSTATQLSSSDVGSTIAVQAAVAAPSFLSNPSYAISAAIDNLHITLGIPYWEAIVLLTLAVRTAMIPLSIIQLKSQDTMMRLKPEMDKINEAMRLDPDKSSQNVQHYSKQIRQLYAKHNFKPSSMLMPFMQLPIFIGFYVGIRDMATYFPAVSSGGALWFTDLAAADSTYTWPVINGISMLFMFEASSALQPVQPQPTQQTEQMKWVFRALSVGVVPLMLHLPTGLFVHWGANNFFSILQTIILSRPAVRTLIGVKGPLPPPPPPQSKVAHPNKK
jgi:YidC/Oxa1 family membrane protein insertase